MDAGFSRAMVSILDANITTLISAADHVPVRRRAGAGFAWTLSIGVFTSVFSAVLVTQVLLGLVVPRRQARRPCRSRKGARS